MTNDRARTIIDYVCRDIDAVIAPELTSPRAQFLAGAIKSLLQGLDNSALSGADMAPGAGLAELLQAAERQRPATGGAREAAYQQSGSGLAVGAQQGEGPIAPIDAAMLTAWFAGRDDYAWVEEVDVSQTSGGFSKETYLVTATGGGRQEDMVLRRDPRFAALTSTVIDEFPLLSALGVHDLPIPRTLWLEADPAPFGAPVMAMARIVGSADVATWSQDPETARGVIGEAARLLARLHEPDLLTAYGAAQSIPGSNGDTPAAMVTDLHSFWRSLDRVDPLVDGVFDWLEKHAPAAFARRALVHGDFGFHNLLVAHGQLAGLLDWEFAHIGDAAEDLAYARPFIEQVLPWAEFETLYHAHGGAVVEPAAVHFWGVFGILRIGLACHATIAQIDAANPRLDTKAAYVGMSFATPFVIDAAKLALGTA